MHKTQCRGLQIRPKVVAGLGLLGQTSGRPLDRGYPSQVPHPPTGMHFSASFYGPKAHTRSPNPREKESVYLAGRAEGPGTRGGKKRQREPSRRTTRRLLLLVVDRAG